MAILKVAIKNFFVCSLGFLSIKAWLVTIYCVEECVICGFVFCKSLICCVKLIQTCPTLLEYYLCAIVELYVEGWVKSIVDGDPELGRHWGKWEYVYKGLFTLKTSKSNFLELRCGNSLSVHHLCMPWVPLLNHMVGCFGQDSCFWWNWWLSMCPGGSSSG